MTKINGLDLIERIAKRIPGSVSAATKDSGIKDPDLVTEISNSVNAIMTEELRSMLDDLKRPASGRRPIKRNPKFATCEIKYISTTSHEFQTSIIDVPYTFRFYDLNVSTTRYDVITWINRHYPDMGVIDIYDWSEVI